MEICELEIKSEALARAPEEVKACVFHLSRAADEISLLQKCFGLAVVELYDLNDSIRSIQQNTAFALVFLLAGKTYEAWNLLQESLIRNPEMREFQQKLPSETRDLLTQIKRYFSGQNLIKTIRDKASFHYDHTMFKQELAECRYPEMNRMFIAEQAGNCHFYIGGFVATSTIMNVVPGADTIEKIKHLTQEVGKTADWFRTLTHALFVEVFSGNDVERKWFTVDADSMSNSARIPCFLIPEEKSKKEQL